MNNVSLWGKHNKWVIMPQPDILEWVKFVLALGGDVFLVVIFKRFVRKSNISRHERTLACFNKKCQFCYMMSSEMCEFKDVQMVNEVRTNSSVLVEITCTSFKWRLLSAYEECQCHSLGHCGWQVQFMWQFWLSWSMRHWCLLYYFVMLLFKGHRTFLCRFVELVLAHYCNLSVRVHQHYYVV
jgi:hypothetical protein